MRQISAAVQEGAKAYLNRQVVTSSTLTLPGTSMPHFSGA